MDKCKIEELLSGFSLFKDMDSGEWNRMAEISLERDWRKGSIIFHQDDPLTNVYFIAKGMVKIFKNDVNGKEQVVAILKEGDMFPHVGFFRKGGYPAYAEALKDSTLIVVPVSGFEKVLIENPELSIKVFRVLGEKIADLQDRLEAQILNNSYEQIIKLLLRLSKTHGDVLQDGLVRVKMVFTNKDLANMIGSTRETVSRTLTRLRRTGLLKTDAKGNLLFHPEELLDELI
ncbi:Crp/Fnr family transcriptional regulator [Bacillus massilinigeriensis]|uniref:Crp/Fnr family transcriptional regulator n=1 Tax=Bacillus mediterraneensis TaxID=1805474 RepID=UPI000B090FBC|nr:Crp/Fnr family transcriptional regulator [Bacillus mediterraneensis]